MVRGAVPQLVPPATGPGWPPGTSDSADSDDNLVLDPWPRQEPEVFKLKDFRWCYGWWFMIGAAVGVAPDTERYDLGGHSGYPTHGGPVYWNRLCPGAPEGKNRNEEPESPRRAKRSHIRLNCPAHLEISSTKGQLIGFSDGKLICEIPESELFAYRDTKDDYHWYRHTDTFKPGAYRFQARQKPIAEGPRGPVF